MSDEHKWREEWAVRHAQGVFTGSSYAKPLNEKEARAWADENRKRDERRRIDARGKTRLLRRFTTDWEEAD